MRTYKTQLNIHIEVSLVERLHALADKRDTTAHQLAVGMIRRQLDELEKEAEKAAAE